MASSRSHRNICRLQRSPKRTDGPSSRPQAKGCHPVPALPCVRYHERVVMTADRNALRQSTELMAAVRGAARQEQFLEVILPEEARRRFEGAIDQSPLPAEPVRITQAPGLLLASYLPPSTDLPP